MSELEDGWGATTPPGDTILREFVDSSAHYFVDVGRAVGARVLDQPHVAVAHHGAEFPFANVGIVRRPLDTTEWRETIAELRADFTGRPPFVIMSPFPTPDLRPDGHELVGHPPFMVRPAGPAPAPEAAGLVIEPVSTTEELAEFEATLMDAYPAGPAGTMLTPPLLEVDDVSLWLGRVDGIPVATAIAHHGRQLNGVELISCRSGFRGRGIGEAMTWRATRADPTRPAALIASDLGRGVYERMGYVALLRVTLWMIR